MQNTFVVSKIDLKKMLSPLGVSPGSIESILNILDKSHKHVDAIAFVGMLQKLGLSSDNIENILRRIGIDDTRIIEIFNSLDEEKIEAMYGKVAELKVE
ncbi:MAG: hypothetical protein ACP5M9_01110 [Candidatus Micrarchaeia archaeon]